MNYCFTLSFNTTPIIEEAVRSLYDLNDNFKHYIFDVGFPVLEPDKIPEDIEVAKKINSIALKEMANRYGSEYVKIDNVGVSQNWNKAIEIINPGPNDVLIGIDPDERPQTKGWVDAFAKVLKVDNIAMASLMITEHIPSAYSWAAELKETEGISYYEMHGVINMAIIGFSGRFINEIKTIPVPELANTYGYLEWVLMPLFTKHDVTWAVLENHIVNHLFATGHYAKWKEYIIWTNNDPVQISFENYLKL